MTEHLNGEAMDELLIGKGDARPEVAEHLQACAVCREEVTSLRAAMGDWREAAVFVADVEHARAGKVERAPAKRVWWSLPALAGVPVAAAVAALLMLPAHRGGNVPAPVAVTPVASAAGDAALLDAIEKDLTASVPEAMEPLSSETRSTSARQAARAQDAKRM